MTSAQIYTGCALRNCSRGVGRQNTCKKQLSIPNNTAVASGEPGQINTGGGLIKVGQC